MLEVYHIGVDPKWNALIPGVIAFAAPINWPSRVMTLSADLRDAAVSFNLASYRVNAVDV